MDFYELVLEARQTGDFSKVEADIFNCKNINEPLKRGLF